MITFILGYISIVVSAFFNSVMDATENTPNFNESVFKNLNKRFWCKDVSWQFAKRVFGYKFDAWHMSKSAMIMFLAVSIILFSNHPVHVIHSVGIGIVWNFTFWLFYHKIFKVK